MGKRIRDWELEGETNAAQVICLHVSRKLADRNIQVEAVTNQVKTLLAVRWSRHLITTIGRPFINQLIRRIKVSGTQAAVIDEITRRICQASDEAGPVFPEECEEWKFFILRNNLTSGITLQEWASAISQLMTVSPMSLCELGELTKGEMLLWTHTYPELHPIPRLWTTVRGSPEFWKGHRAELLAMCKQLGKPTLFLTFSKVFSNMCLM